MPQGRTSLDKRVTRVLYVYLSTTLRRFAQIIVSDQFWRTAGAFSKDDHLSKTSSQRVPCAPASPPRPHHPMPHPHHTQIDCLKSLYSNDFMQGQVEEREKVRRTGVLTYNVESDGVWGSGRLPNKRSCL